MERTSIFTVDTQTTLLKGQVDLSMLQGDEVQLVSFVSPSILDEVWRVLQVSENPSLNGSTVACRHFVSDLASSCQRFSLGEVVVQYKSEHTVFTELILSETDCISLDVLFGNSTLSCFMLTSIEVLRLLDSFVQPEVGRWIIHNATSYGLDHHLIQLAKRRGIGIISILDSSKPMPSFKNDPQHHLLFEGPSLKEDVVRIVRQDPVCLGLDTGIQSAPIVSLLNSIRIKRYACFPIHQTIEKTYIHSSREHLFFSLDPTVRNQKK